MSYIQKMPADMFRATNEPILQYSFESDERKNLQTELKTQLNQQVEIPLVLGGQRVFTENRISVVCPHDHHHVLGSLSQANEDHTQLAITRAQSAQREWAHCSLDERAAVFLKAADLLAGPWRQRINAATMLGQSKTVHQAEIDASCELIDFLRFNVQFAYEINQQQPISSSGIRNQMDYRPLEGFVYAVTPFNFTAIAGNLATAPVLMGNSVVWKPSSTAALSNYMFLELLEEAGLPPGVINFVPGKSEQVSSAAMTNAHLAGVHFTGSTAVFNQLWLQVAKNLSTYRGYPRLVGETGGKDFVLAHGSADIEGLTVALLRGAFEYQGQKCSAASRAYIPESIWPQVKSLLLDMVSSISMGDVTDFKNFMGAVIDKKAYERITNYINFASRDAGANILTKVTMDSSVGYFVSPTVIEVKDPAHRLMSEEIFGPVLTVHVFKDQDWDAALRLIDQTSPYALTGAVFARDRSAILQAQKVLRFSAGNFYINDKPTGAVVGQQPFGGARHSGTNDKAGSSLNLLRWVSPRTIKETNVPAHKYQYPHMA